MKEKRTFIRTCIISGVSCLQEIYVVYSLKYIKDVNAEINFSYKPVIFMKGNKNAPFAPYFSWINMISKTSCTNVCTTKLYSLFPYLKLTVWPLIKALPGQSWRMTEATRDFIKCKFASDWIWTGILNTNLQIWIYQVGRVAKGQRGREV